MAGYTYFVYHYSTCVHQAPRLYRTRAMARAALRRALKRFRQKEPLAVWSGSA